MKYRTPLGYDSSLDRLVNGEQYRPFQHLFTKSSLLSGRRGRELIEALKKFGAVYSGRFGADAARSRPYPVPLMMIQLQEFPVEEHGRPRMISIPDLLTLEELSTAPPEYLELMNLVCVVGGRSLAHELPPPLGPQALTSFARELFRLILCAHRGCLCVLYRGSGTCLTEEFVTSTGGCDDFYFLTSLEGEPDAAIFSARQRDLIDGFALVVRRADSPTAIAAGLNEGLQIYIEGQRAKEPAAALIRATVGAPVHALRDGLSDLAALALSKQT